MQQPSSKSRLRLLVRPVALTMMGAFLVAQSWLVCAPLCSMHVHEPANVTDSHMQTHGLLCHSDGVILSQLPQIQSLGAMLPARVAAAIPVLPETADEFLSPSRVHLQRLPPADPPPPRLV